eukprot:6203004-Pleurochrysis_carterae.AAC.2
MVSALSGPWTPCQRELSRAQTSWGMLVEASAGGESDAASQCAARHAPCACMSLVLSHAPLQVDSPPLVPMARRSPTAVAVRQCAQCSSRIPRGSRSTAPDSLSSERWQLGRVGLTLVGCEQMHVAAG